MPQVPHVLPYFIGVDEETQSVVLAIRGGQRARWEAAGGAQLRHPPPRLTAKVVCAFSFSPVSAGSLSLDDVVRDLLFEPGVARKTLVFAVPRRQHGHPAGHWPCLPPSCPMLPLCAG